MVYKSASNIHCVETAISITLNVYDILRYDKLIIAKDAVTIIQKCIQDLNFQTVANISDERRNIHGI
ncbi:50S ribosomal protein L4 [Brevibacillus choshinensis]|uniref:50S ribosomal protein L4 n=1 Tax=Brevibacillus choshinensis TaxID=54911 RepID=UPI00128FAA20